MLSYFVCAKRYLHTIKDIDLFRCHALIQPVADGQERITGRDVLNQQRVLFDGIAGQAVADP